MTSPAITQRTIRAMFYERLMQNAATSLVDAIATQPLDSDQDSEEYGWLGMVPTMSQKLGEKKFSQIRDTEWAVRNIEYQGGIKLPKKHILYDKTGQIQVRIDELADRTSTHWWSLISQLIIDGESAACYDGQYFFDTDHSEGNSGTQSNDITSDVTTTTNPTATEMIDAILSGVEAIIGFKDDQGEYVNENLNEYVIVTGKSFVKNGLKALSQTQINSGDSNILIEQDSFRFRVFSSPRITWTDRFALIATQGTQKPFIRQQRRPNNSAPGYNIEGILMEMLWLDSEYCKLNDECLVSVETERAAAYGDWKKACLVTLV